MSHEVGSSQIFAQGVDSGLDFMPDSPSPRSGATESHEGSQTVLLADKVGESQLGRPLDDAGVAAQADAVQNADAFIVHCGLIVELKGRGRESMVRIYQVSPGTKVAIDSL